MLFGAELITKLGGSQLTEAMAMLWLLRWPMRRWWRLPWWVRLPSLALAPLITLNLCVAFFGASLVSPFSPFFLRDKWTALKLYAKHRPTCLWSGHTKAQEVARLAEKETDLPPGLFQAIVEVESENRPHRISFAGAMGPAQLVPGTARQLGVEDPFDTDTAIRGGARYLSSLLRRTKDISLAVAAYNAGPGAVNGEIPRNGETEFYVAKVMRRYQALRASTAKAER